MKNKIYGWSKTHYEAKRKRKEKLKNNRKTLILTLLLLSVISSVLYFGKIHRTRECIVTYVNDDNLTIRVQHPNGLEYGCSVDCTENLDVGDTIKVSFNELTDWEKYFIITSVGEVIPQ